MRVEKNPNILPIEFICTSHNSVLTETFSSNFTVIRKHQQIISAPSKITSKVTLSWLALAEDDWFPPF